MSSINCVLFYVVCEFEMNAWIESSSLLVTSSAVNIFSSLVLRKQDPVPVAEWSDMDVQYGSETVDQRYRFLTWIFLES